MNENLKIYLEWVKIDDALFGIKNSAKISTGHKLSSSHGIVRYMSSYIPKEEHHDFFLELLPKLEKNVVADIIKGYNASTKKIYEYNVLVNKILLKYMENEDFSNVKDNLKYLSPKLAGQFLINHGDVLLNKVRKPEKVLDIVKYYLVFDDFAFNKTLKAINDYPIKPHNYKYQNWKNDILSMKFNKIQKEQVLAAMIIKELS